MNDDDYVGLPPPVMTRPISNAGEKPVALHETQLLLPGGITQVNSTLVPIPGLCGRQSGLSMGLQTVATSMLP